MSAYVYTFASTYIDSLMRSNTYSHIGFLCPLSCPTHIDVIVLLWPMDRTKMGRTDVQTDMNSSGVRRTVRYGYDFRRQESVLFCDFIATSRDQRVVFRVTCSLMKYHFRIPCEPFSLHVFRDHFHKIQFTIMLIFLDFKRCEFSNHRFIWSVVKMFWQITLKKLLLFKVLHEI